MNLWEKIMEVYPDLTALDFDRDLGSISLQDDSDGLGAYIAKWEHSNPLPKGFTLGKPATKSK